LFAHAPNTFKLKVIDLTNDTTVVATTGTNSQTLQPSANRIYEIVNLYYWVDAPIGDTSGTHELEALWNTTRRIWRIVGNHSTTLSINEWAFGGDNSEAPSGIDNQYEMQHRGRVWASNSEPVIFKYSNKTDANQTGTRTLEILVKEYMELLG
jgi:hypothetical protein